VALGDVIARLAVSLDLQTASFERGSKKAQAEAKTMRSSLTKAAGAISAAFAGMVSWQVVQQLRDMTRAAIDAAGGLGEEAAALGVSAQALQEYRYAATQVGLEQGEMDKGLEQLTRRMGEAALGAKAPVEAFRLLGISMADIKGKGAGDVIPLIADGMAKIEDPAMRAAIAVDLFGKSGQKLATLLGGGAAEVNKLREAAHELGIVLSDEDIQHADEIADKLAALNFVIEAQQNKKLLENADALLKFEETLGSFKLALIDFAGKADTYFGQIEKASQNFGQFIYNNMTRPVLDMRAAVQNAVSFVVNAMGNMVTAIGNAINSRLSAIWDGALNKIEQVKSAFRNLWDAVIGHSYIPDMVDGIAAEMARLDAVMVQPIKKATAKAQEAFRDLASDVRGILDRAFPEAARRRGFLDDAGRIEAGVTAGLIDRATADAARRALAADLGFRERPEIAWMDDVKPLTDGVHGFEDAIVSLGQKAKVNTVRITESFKDMADKTLQSLSRLTSAIKDGGFLGILEAVIGFGLQLGSTGLFGKGIQTKINAPAYASGTNFHPGGLALVGERGPELVSMPRGSRVTPNGKMGGNTYYFSGNLMTPEFWAMIQNGDIQAAHGGAMLAGARSARSKKWSLAA
jgi:hypothetical protein